LREPLNARRELGEMNFKTQRTLAAALGALFGVAISLAAGLILLQKI
jgi:hypothetical protein